MNPVLVDAHAHLHEYSDNDIRGIIDGERIYIVAVSDDKSSSLRTLKLSQEYPDRIRPCIGLHPWEVGKVEAPIASARELVRLAERYGVDCFGEVGLDTKFVGETISVQRKVFSVFVEAAREMGAVMNLHTAGTWREVFEEIERAGIERANFHWYTGPHDLLEGIKEMQYTISINPAVLIQKKHQKIVEIAPLDIMLTESDAPYNYRGLKLSPLMVGKVLEKIAEIKRVSVEIVADTVVSNARRVFRLSIEAGY